LLSEEIARPKYDRSRMKAGIVHIGVGGFHRSHDRHTEGGQRGRRHAEVLLLTIGKPLYKPVSIPTVKGNATPTSRSAP
jgi:hypothetical protein